MDLGYAPLRAALLAALILLPPAAHAFDFQRFERLRNTAQRAAASAADPVALRTLQSFDGPDLVGADGPMARAGMDLTLLYHEHADYVTRGRPGPFVPSPSAIRLEAERVLIHAVADDDAAALLAQLEGLGLDRGAARGGLVSGWLPITQLEAAARLPSLRSLRPALAFTNAGVVTSQGDAALAAAAARAAFGVDGTGVTVGAISDSFNCLGGYASDVGTGDLPPGVTVLEEPTPVCDGDDEGRAMLQIVHDLAPGASLAFHSGFNGIPSFAQGIAELVVQAGADIIVDDVGYLDDPMFQDGAIAQTIDAAVAQGVAYFSAAGNLASQSYESDYRPGGSSIGNAVGQRHDFNPDAAVTDRLQSFELSGNASVVIALQWNQPFKSVSGGSGASGDLDLVIYDTPPHAVAISGQHNIGGDPVDAVQYTNPSSQTVTLQLAIEKRSGTSPTRVKYVWLVQSGTFTPEAEPGTQGGAVFGHANAAQARAVGAAWYANTPAFGVSPPLLNGFSSRGGTTILVGPTGLPVNQPRQKPELTAADGVDTSFFGSTDSEGNGFRNFFGTSAAAPHAAAIAALVRAAVPTASPAEQYSALLETAVDMAAPGQDDDSGAGLVQADRALAYAAANAGSGVLLGFGATPSGTALTSSFDKSLFAVTGVTITDSDASPQTSATALPGAGPTGPLSGRFLLVPGGGSAWVDLTFDPAADEIRFDFATPGGQVQLTGRNAAGAVIYSAAASGTLPFTASDGSQWLAGTATLPGALALSKLRIEPMAAGAPLALDNLRFRSLSAGADVPIPAAAWIVAALLLSALAVRKIGAARHPRATIPG